MSYRERNGLGHDTEPKPSKASAWWRAKREEQEQAPINTGYAEQRRTEEFAADLAEKAADREAAAEPATVLILEAPVPV